MKMEADRGYPQAAAHDTFWDFIGPMPESTHMIMRAMSDRTIPRSLQMMEGFGVNTFRLLQAAVDRRRLMTRREASSRRCLRPAFSTSRGSWRAGSSSADFTFWLPTTLLGFAWIIRRVCVPDAKRSLSADLDDRVNGREGIVIRIRR